MVGYDGEQRQQYNNQLYIDYGFIQGSKTVLLIIAGQGGTIYGYDDKYVKMAEQYNSKYGVTVVTASNPYDGSDILGFMVEFVRNLVGEDAKIYCLGVSNGGRLSSQYAHLYPNIKKLTIVNAPLMINWHRTKAGIEAFRGEYVRFVYGSRDPSASYAELIHMIKNDSLEVTLTVVADADHHFKAMEQEFQMLPEEMFEDMM